MKADFIPNTEMGNLIRANDWSKSPVGPIDSMAAKSSHYIEHYSQF
jgi:hypothetical protein